MKLLKGGTISLPVYIEDSNNDPVTGYEANVRVDINFTDNSTPDADNIPTGADGGELDDGWYYYNYTDTTGVDFIYVGRDATTNHKNFPGGLVEIVNEYDTSGTHTHAMNELEQELFEKTTSSGLKRFKGIWIDLYIGD